jgi:hypothetical protein
MVSDPERLDEIDRLGFQAEIAHIVGPEQAKRVSSDGDFTLGVLHNEQDEFRARKIVKIAETFKERARTTTWSERLAIISGIAAAMVLIIQARRRLQSREHNE